MTEHAKLITRAEAALTGVTDGPWVVTYERGCTHLRMGEKRDSQMCDETYYPWVPENLNDWEFFAAARDLVPDLIAALNASEARVHSLENAVGWYGHQVRLCRRHGKEGDEARNTLSEDRGQRAVAALKGGAE